VEEKIIGQKGRVKETASSIVSTLHLLIFGSTIHKLKPVHEMWAAESDPLTQKKKKKKKKKIFPESAGA
jgi:hypothetical protein